MDSLKHHNHSSKDAACLRLASFPGLPRGRPGNEASLRSDVYVTKIHLCMNQQSSYHSE